MKGSKETEYIQQIVALEAKIENLERRNRMLGIELDCQKLTKNYTPEEIAEILRISAATVRNEIRRGKLHSYVIGDRYLIGPKHLQDYLISIEI